MQRGQQSTNNDNQATMMTATWFLLVGCNMPSFHTIKYIWVWQRSSMYVIWYDVLQCFTCNAQKVYPAKPWLVCTWILIKIKTTTGWMGQTKSLKDSRTMNFVSLVTARISLNSFKSIFPSSGGNKTTLWVVTVFRGNDVLTKRLESKRLPKYRPLRKGVASFWYDSAWLSVWSASWWCHHSWPPWKFPASKLRWWPRWLQSPWSLCGSGKRAWTTRSHFPSKLGRPQKAMGTQDQTDLLSLTRSGWPDELKVDPPDGASPRDTPSSQLTSHHFKSSLQVSHRGWFLGGKLCCFHVVVLPLNRSKPLVFKRLMFRTHIRCLAGWFLGGKLCCFHVVVLPLNRSKPLVFKRLMFRTHIRCLAGWFLGGKLCCFHVVVLPLNRSKPLVFKRLMFRTHIRCLAGWFLGGKLCCFHVVVLPLNRSKPLVFKRLMFRTHIRCLAGWVLGGKICSFHVVVLPLVASCVHAFGVFAKSAVIAPVTTRQRAWLLFRRNRCAAWISGQPMPEMPLNIEISWLCIRRFIPGQNGILPSFPASKDSMFYLLTNMYTHMLIITSHIKYNN